MPVGRDSTLDEILDRGSLRIPIEFLGHPDTGDPPEMYRDPHTGEPDGLAPRVGAMIASDLGVKLEIVEILWPDQIPALFDRRVDLLPKHTLYPQRALRLEFVMGRLMQIRVTCQVPADRADQGIESLYREGRRIGVWHGSSNRDVAERFFPAATVVEAPAPTRLLLDGRVDAVVGDAAIPRTQSGTESVAGTGRHAGSPVAGIQQDLDSPRGSEIPQLAEQLVRLPGRGGGHRGTLRDLVGEPHGGPGVAGSLRLPGVAPSVLRPDLSYRSSLPRPQFKLRIAWRDK